MPNNTPNTNNSNALENKIDNLITNINILIRGLERGWGKYKDKDNQPIFRPRYESEKANDKLRSRNTYTDFDFNKHMDDFIQQFTDAINSVKNIKKNIEDSEKELSQINNELTQNLSQDVREKKEARKKLLEEEIVADKENLEKAKKNKNSLFKNNGITQKELREVTSSRKSVEEKQKLREELFEKNRVIELKKAVDEWYNSMSEVTKAQYGYNKQLKNEADVKEKLAEILEEKADFNAREEIRDEAQREINTSGLPRGIQKFLNNRIESQRKTDSITRFQSYLNKEGGAQRIAQAMGLGPKATETFGKVVNFATKTAGSFAKLAGKANILIAVLQSVGEVVQFFVNAVNEATKDIYKHQTDTFETDFQRHKEIMTTTKQLQEQEIRVRGKKQMRELQMQGEIMLNNLRTVSQQYAKSADIAMTIFTEGINEAAYKAANASVDASVEILKNLNVKKTLGQQYENFTKLQDTQFENYKQNVTKQINALNVSTNIKLGEIALSQTQEQNRKWQEYLVTGLFGPNGNVMENSQAYLEQMKESGLNITNVFSEQDKLKSSYGGYDTDPNFFEKMGRSLASGELLGKLPGVGLVGKEVDKTIGNLFGISNWETANEIQKMGYKMENLGDLQTAEFESALQQANTNLFNTAAQYTQQIADESLNIEKQKRDILLETAAEIKKSWLQLAQFLEKYNEKFDTMSNDMGISLGITNPEQLRSYQMSMHQINKDIAKYGKNYEDYFKAQKKYTESTGRNKMMTSEDFGQMTMLGKYLGDEDLAAQYASDMEIFNAGVDQSVDLLDKSLQEVNKIGLNGRKYTKTLVENLKLAQKYNFKDGTKGLMEMAKWAENTRFNLSSLSSIVDSIWEGGLEGLITKGAGFQVLGGNAAMNADPLAMMFEAYSDPEALAKRYQDMTMGFGEVDKVTGETTFSGLETMHIQQLAKLQGRPYEELANEIRARNKKNVVKGQLGFNANDDQLSYISNNAYYDREEGTWKINTFNEKGEVTPQDVNALTEDMLKDIVPEEHNDKMEAYMQQLLSAVENMSAGRYAILADAAAATYEEMLKQYEERTRKANEDYATQREKYIQNAKDGMVLTTEAFEGYLNMWKKGNTEVDAALGEINKKAGKIETALNATAELIEAANKKIAAASGSIGVSTTNSTNQTQSKVKTVKEGDVIDMNDKIAQEVVKVGQRYGNEYNEGNAHVTSSMYDRTPRWTKEGASNYNWLASEKKTGEGLAEILTKKTQDAYIPNNNQSMYVAASKVTPIQDGGVELAKSDPQDEVLFAKKGGVIDSIVNRNFASINKLAKAVEPLAYNNGYQGGGSGLNNIGDLKLNVSGTIKLESDGKSVDLDASILENRVFIHNLSRLLAEQYITSANYGMGSHNLMNGNPKFSA